MSLFLLYFAASCLGCTAAICLIITVNHCINRAVQRHIEAALGEWDDGLTQDGEDRPLERPTGPLRLIKTGPQ